MSEIPVRRMLAAAAAAVLFTTLDPAAACAQAILGAGGFGGGQFGAGGFGGALGRGGLAAGGQGGQAGQAGQAGAQAGGILIDAQGVVQAVFVKEKSPQLEKQRMLAAAKEFLAADMNKPSPLRKVSLVRLEAECEAYARRKELLPVEIHFLAGLQRIDYIFAYPETGDLVIAGPAEGFAPDAAGRVVGLSTGRPPLRLDDLVVALRTLERAGTLGCSIDPDRDRLAQLNQFLAHNSTPASTSVIAQRFQTMGKILGMQDVRVWGVPADSHFAQTLVEADLRMKRISVGLDPPPVKGLVSHLSLLTPGGNSMQRWWFTPLYDAFFRSEDNHAFQLAGQRAQLLAQEELVDPAGNRINSPFTRQSTQKFAQIFTDKFPELADSTPIFAELQSLIDLAIMAALFKKEQLPDKVGWKMSLFLDAARMPLLPGHAPTQAPTVVNYRMTGRGVILGLVSGGVTINPLQTVREIEFRHDPAKRLEGLLSSSLPQNPPEAHPWWWD